MLLSELLIFVAECQSYIEIYVFYPLKQVKSAISRRKELRLDEKKRAVLEEKMAVLRKGFIDHLDGRSNEIAQLWRDYIRNQNDPEILFNLYRNVHSLAGSGATFGYDELGRRARNMEIILRACKERNAPPPNEEVQQLEELMSLMMEEIDSLVR